MHLRSISLPVLVAALMLVMVACGGTPQPTPASTPDIEATVEARIEEKQAEDAALEAKAQTMAKAMVEATAQAAPTAPPVPPTPTPTQTPTPTATTVKDTVQTTTSVPLTPEEALTQRAEAAALERSNSDWLEAYNYLSPRSREVCSNGDYALSIGMAMVIFRGLMGIPEDEKLTISVNRVTVAKDVGRVYAEWQRDGNVIEMRGDGGEGWVHVAGEWWAEDDDWEDGCEMPFASKGTVTASPPATPVSLTGTLWAWGSNWNGALGIGHAVGNQAIPTQEITGATDWVVISAGWGHTVALKSDGTLWAWGLNNYGQVGDGSEPEESAATHESTTPTQESTGATNWSAIAAGDLYTVGLKSDGTLWSWGRNSLGQLGDGTNTKRTSPTQEASAATDWTAIAAGGYHTVALKSDGTLWAWGYNEYGELGDGTNTKRTSLTQESTGATNWSAIAAGGYHTVALKSDGTLWAWGNNEYGQLGDGTNTKRTSPTQEASAATDWVAISAGEDHTVALKSDGTLWAWGYNEYGELGDGTNTKRTSPTQESTGATNWSAIAAGEGYTVGLKSDGTLWAWGYNDQGEIGDGTWSDRNTPTQEASAATDWVAISAGSGWGGGHTVALK